MEEERKTVAARAFKYNVGQITDQLGCVSEKRDAQGLVLEGPHAGAVFQKHVTLNLV
jgi:hypothetical protein